MEIRRTARIIGIVALFAGFVAWIVPPTTPAPAGPAVALPQVRPALARPALAGDDADPAGFADASDRTDSSSPDRDADAIMQGGAPEPDALSGDRAADGDFRAGYRWAEQEGVQSPRECAGQPSDAAEAGCRRYLTGADAGWERETRWD